MQLFFLCASVVLYEALAVFLFVTYILLMFVVPLEGFVSVTFTGYIHLNVFKVTDSLKYKGSVKNIDISHKRTMFKIVYGVYVDDATQEHMADAETVCK